MPLCILFKSKLFFFLKVWNQMKKNENIDMKQRSFLLVTNFRMLGKQTKIKYVCFWFDVYVSIV